MTSAPTPPGFDPQDSGWPRPRPGLTAAALVLIVAIVVIFVVLIRAEKNAALDDDGVEIGAIDPQASMLGKILGASLDHPDLRAGVTNGMVEATEPWMSGPIAMQLARAIVMAIDDRATVALQSFHHAEESARDGGRLDEAAPLFRVTAAILRAKSVAQNADASLLAEDPGIPVGTATAVIDAWGDPSEEDFAAAKPTLGSLLALGRAEAMGDAAARSSLARSGVITLGAIAGIFGWGCLALLGGVAAIITLTAMAGVGRVRSGIGEPRPESSVLLEVFAVYLAITLAMSLAVGGVMMAFGDDAFVAGPAMRIVMFVLLIGGQVCSTIGAFAWWFWRGGTWSGLCDAVGLRMPGGPWRMLWTGMVGYSMAVVLLGVGFVISLVLSRMLGMRDLGSPSHPIHELLADEGLLPLIVTFFIGAVTAPIVEEIFFRGALYRGLRDRIGVGRAAVVAGAAGATLVSSFLFAAIHPQGLLLAPVLAGIGAGFCLTREWTGSVIPGMIGHAVNNALILALGAVLLA